MKFTETEIPGVWIIDPEPQHDERGYFARLWCAKEFAERGLNPNLAQVSLSYNKLAGTIRGMHWQAAPHAEAKLIRVTRGAIWDVTIDMRKASSTYCRWTSLTITADSHQMLYVPEGCAHGFQALSHSTEVEYSISDFFHSALASGLRWNDPTFAIPWPLTPTSVSTRDQAFPLFQSSST